MAQAIPIFPQAVRIALASSPVQPPAGEMCASWTVGFPWAAGYHAGREIISTTACSARDQAHAAKVEASARMTRSLETNRTAEGAELAATWAFAHYFGHPRAQHPAALARCRQLRFPPAGALLGALLHAPADDGNAP